MTDRQREEVERYVKTGESDLLFHVPGTDHLGAHEYVSVLTEAAGARNGWKRILRRCAPTPGRRR
jgi:hypothetical protein